MTFLNLHIQSIIVLLVGLVGLFKLSQLNFSGKLILVLVWQNFFVDLYATYLADSGFYNIWVYNIHLPIQYSLTLFIYSTLFEKKKRSIIYLIIPIVILFAMLNGLFIQQNLFNTYTIFLSGTFIAIISYLLLRDYVVEESNLFSNLSFWFIAANFIYFIISINTLNSMPLAVEVSSETAKKLLAINYFAYILWSILIGTGFICLKKTTISYSL